MVVLKLIGKCVFIFGWSSFCQWGSWESLIIVLSQVLEATEKCDGKVNTWETKYHLYFIKGLCLRAILNPRNSSLSYGGWVGARPPPCVFSSLLKATEWRKRLGLYFLKEHQFQEGQKQAVFYSVILLSNTELGTRRVEPGQGGYNQWTSPCGEEC